MIHPSVYCIHSYSKWLLPALVTEMTGFTIMAFAPNIIEDIGCLKKKNNDYYPTNTLFTVIVYPRKLFTIQSVPITTKVVSSNPAHVRCTRYNIMWSSFSVTCDRSVVSSTRKTDSHDIIEILLKVAFSTKKPTNNIYHTKNRICYCHSLFLLN
jgi:hypothetical protein